MSDIFREVEEEVRRERLEQLWKKYGDYIIAGAALLVIAVAGLQLWRVYDQKQRIRASEEYSAAMQMVQSGQSAVAAVLFERLAKTAPGGYAAVARLQQADAMLSSGNRADAIAIYKQIGAGNDPILGAIARIHAAWTIVDQAPRQEVESLLAPLTTPASAWTPMADEILAYADYREGNTNAAIGAYQSLTANKSASDGVRQRAQAMAQFLNAGGDKNFGTVPEPPGQAQTPGVKSTGAEGPPTK